DPEYSGISAARHLGSASACRGFPAPMRTWASPAPAVATATIQAEANAAPTRMRPRFRLGLD
ncbi:MAG: hypothetical protein SPG40_11060, partial [Kiritimatiellia bacterium]|nr:hypothetical protein [Kiritimatiellia bacterium]